MNFDSSTFLRDSIPGEKAVVRLGIREGFLSRARTLGWEIRLSVRSPVRSHCCSGKRKNFSWCWNGWVHL